MNEQQDVLVVGTGYLGKRVAQIAHQLGYRVFTTTRRPERLDELKRAGFHPILLDWNDSRTFSESTSHRREGFASIEQAFSPHLRVLVAVSYDSRGRLGRYESQVLGFRRLLHWLPPDSRVAYVSTTGVYHQTGGVWVDERSPTHPSREAAAVHLQAEQQLHRTRPSGKYLILRLAGIYGPERIPRIADVAAGTPVQTNPSTYLNLIHVDDAAQACVNSWDYMDAEQNEGASIQRRLFLVADNMPVQRGDFYNEIARQTHSPKPNFVPPSANASPRRRGETDKRICSRKMRRLILPSLRYPDFRQGLVSALQ
ncbi:NAD-dependent epimerase/dehydratase family protein [Stieleria sp. JC731]|uniref:NAD-dependent epimerase/dehydratase family protein n=1 Tax=Pirellulaceae TaxID=2691357 RepID=UPI001E42A412|nr:NAD-dependent epimerase/dehydratase family protein [Stieleria sp. JC731]MCC9604049.1 NAD-dependent epimerase/dehydratase family protein [Stieleria sp. JC731]